MSAVLGTAAVELSRTDSFDGLNLVFRLVLVAAGAFFFP